MVGFDDHGFHGAFDGAFRVLGVGAGHGNPPVSDAAWGLLDLAPAPELQYRAFMQLSQVLTKMKRSHKNVTIASSKRMS
ncbi:hypothetical protein DC3_27820 [Deinococcus cellulosilyticus NBRC 106333 = KACC 11606]|uniref:Uncharacterized protein n=1 Tax=Deinococcus cellulosilyticus (strain DSM 18568 / NBRC 106333 / KACC 11606 / 5516J-15) TaxID=1223518 RepID=A0A511N3T0_DEIC1|nr:hypothetical protein DC3_27820 [Deinococcus cellulosilyticus NBRC 106333 = KACC 11606]